MAKNPFRDPLSESTRDRLPVSKRRNDAAHRMDVDAMIRKHRKSVVIALGAVLALTAFAAWSGRSQMRETYFFDEIGQLVGEETVPCQGPPIFEGIRTSNYTTYYTNCDPEPPFSWD
jgi:hypothetical protein